MKIKLIEYPYGKMLGFDQETVWFVQTEENGKCETRCVEYGNVITVSDGSIAQLRFAAITDYKTALSDYNKIKEFMALRHKFKIVKEEDI